MIERLNNDVELEPERYELAAGPAYQFELGEMQRRDFFKVLGGGVLIVMALKDAMAQQESGGGGRRGGAPRPVEIGAWLHIAEEVGNVAVAIAWSGYFESILRSVHVELPYWLVHGYGDVMQQLAKATAEANVARIGELNAAIASAPHPFGRPLLVNVPAVAIVAFITWILVRGVRESARVNNWMVLVKLLVLTTEVASCLNKQSDENT